MSKKYETDEERQAARRETLRRYNNSEKGNANNARRDKDKARAAYARYRQTDGYAAAQERRQVKEQATGWARVTERTRQVRMEHPERYGAWLAVSTARRNGTLVRPEACERCGSERRLHAHHHNGYAPEHWLDVQWLCSPCHRTVHR